MASPRHPGRRLRPAGHEVGDAGIDVIDVFPLARPGQQLRLKRTVELAEIVERGCIDHRFAKPRPRRGVRRETQQRVGPPGGAPDDALALRRPGDVIAMEVRRRCGTGDPVTEARRRSREDPPAARDDRGDPPGGSDRL